jgi:hypothetical protein
MGKRPMNSLAEFVGALPFGKKFERSISRG